MTPHRTPAGVVKIVSPGDRQTGSLAEVNGVSFNLTMEPGKVR
jgi:hypothetical protein